MGKRILQTLILILCLAAVGFGLKWYVDTSIQAGFDQILASMDRVLQVHDDQMAGLHARFGGIDNLKTAQELQLRRYWNADHVATARRLGTGPYADSAAVQQAADSGELVRLVETPYYFIQDLTHSVPYVTDKTAELLELIGRRFHEALEQEGLPLFQYCISSVTRIGDNQRELRLINPNAARGRSSHEYGTTVDVVYHRYQYRPLPEDALEPSGYPELDRRLESLRVRNFDAVAQRYWQELQGILGRTLIEIQREGRSIILLEREQPVFHITVSDG